MASWNSFTVYNLKKKNRKKSNVKKCHFCGDLVDLSDSTGYQPLCSDSVLFRHVMYLYYLEVNWNFLSLFHQFPTMQEGSKATTI